MLHGFTKVGQAWKLGQGTFCPVLTVSWLLLLCTDVGGTRSLSPFPYLLWPLRNTTFSSYQEKPVKFSTIFFFLIVMEAKSATFSSHMNLCLLDYKKVGSGDHLQLCVLSFYDWGEASPSIVQ